MIERRSAKRVVGEYISELKMRNDPTNWHLIEAKLRALEVICFRMGWNSLYNQLRFNTAAREQKPMRSTAQAEILGQPTEE